MYMQKSLIIHQYNLSSISIRILPAQPSIFPTGQTHDQIHPFVEIALLPLGTFCGVDFLSLVSDFMLLELAGVGAFEACFGAGLGFVAAVSFIEVLIGSGLGFCDFSLGASDVLEGFTGPEALGSWGFAFGASGAFVGFSFARI